MNEKRTISFFDLVLLLLGTPKIPGVLIVSLLLLVIVLNLSTEILSSWLSNYSVLDIQLNCLFAILLIFLALVFWTIHYLKSREEQFVGIEMRQQEPVGKVGLIITVSKIRPGRNTDRNIFSEGLERIKSSTIDELNRGDFNFLNGSNLEPPLEAIEYHANAGTLKDCWLITTQDSETEQGSNLVPPILINWCRFLHPDQNITFHFGEDLCVAPTDYIGLWNLVDRIFRSSAHKEEKIIADITSGTKLMSIGLSLACLPDKRTMQYMSRERDWKGDPVIDSEWVPLLIDIEPILRYGENGY